MRTTFSTIIFLIILLHANANDILMGTKDILDEEIGKIKNGQHPENPKLYEILIDHNPMLSDTLLQEIRVGKIKHYGPALRLIFKSYPKLARSSQENIIGFFLENRDNSLGQSGLIELANNVEINKLILSTLQEQVIEVELEKLADGTKSSIDAYTLCVLAAKANVPKASTTLKKIKKVYAGESSTQVGIFNAAELGLAILGDVKSIEKSLKSNCQIMNDQVNIHALALAQIRHLTVPLYLISLFDDTKTESFGLPSEGFDLIIEPFNLPIRQAVMEYFPEMAEELGVKHAYQLTNDQVRQWVSTVGIPNLEKEIKESKRKR